MIQDIGDHTYHVEYRPVPLARDGILLSYRGREVLVKLTGEKSFTYPTYGDYDGLEANRFRWLFAEDSQQFYLADEALPERKRSCSESRKRKRSNRPFKRPSVLSNSR